MKYTAAILLLLAYHLQRFMQETDLWSDLASDEFVLGLFGQHLKRLRPHHEVTHMKLVHEQHSLGKRQ